MYLDTAADDECTNDVCHTEFLQMKKQICDYKRKIEESKNEYHEALVSNLKKDMKIENLQEQLRKSQYDEFHGIISSEAIDQLKKIDHSRKKDSSFILAAVQDLYSSDLSRLKHITFSGRNKNPMTPEKKKILADLFGERMKDNPDDTERLNNFGKHVKSAIENIVSKLHK